MYFEKANRLDTDTGLAPVAALSVIPKGGKKSVSG